MFCHLHRDGRDEECTRTPLKGEFRGLFDWVKYARYGGNETDRHRTVEIWDFRVVKKLFDMYMHTASMDRVV